ncbi:MAG: hypothetical protein V1748_04225 [Actinomycetota bacterium]
MRTDPWEILKDSFGTVIRNRCLWAFGFVIALAGGGSQGYNLWLQAPLSGSVTGLAGTRLSSFVRTHWIYALIAGAVGLLIGLGLLCAGVIAQGSAIGAVAEIEGGGSPGVRGSLHWGRNAFFRFLVLVIGYAAVMSLVAVPSLLYWRAWGGTKQMVLPCLGGFALGMGFVVFSIFAGILLELSVRFVVLEGEGIMESLRSAVNLFRDWWKEVLACWFYALLIGVLNIIAMAVVIAGILENPLSALFRSAYDHQSPWLFSVAIAGYFLAWATAALLGTFFVATSSALWTTTFLELEPVAIPGTVS